MCIIIDIFWQPLITVIGAMYGRAGNFKWLNISIVLFRPFDWRSANEESLPMRDKQETADRLEAQNAKKLEFS